MKRTTLLTLVATIGLAVTACSSNDDTVAADAGATATSAAESSPNSADSEDAPTTATAPVSPNLAGLDPCSLLSSEEAAAVTGGPASEPERSANELIINCFWGDAYDPAVGDVGVAVWDMEDFGPEPENEFGTVNGNPAYIFVTANERYCKLWTMLSNERRLVTTLTVAEPRVAALPGYGTTIEPRPEFDPNDPMASTVQLEGEVQDTVWCGELLELTEKVADRTGW